MHAFLLAAAILFSAGAKVWYGALLEDSGYGRLPFEQAAFLIQEKSGALTLAPWESRGHHHARYRGAIPHGTIAIVHTHPANQPQPSAHDRNEAARLRLPVVVVTPSGVRVAMP